MALVSSLSLIARSLIARRLSHGSPPFSHNFAHPSRGSLRSPPLQSPICQTRKSQSTQLRRPPTQRRRSPPLPLLYRPTGSHPLKILTSILPIRPKQKAGEGRNEHSRNHFIPLSHSRNHSIPLHIRETISIPLHIRETILTIHLATRFARRPPRHQIPLAVPSFHLRPPRSPR